MSTKKTDEMQASVANFIDELEKRIATLNSLTMKSNLDPKKRDEIVFIVQKYIPSIEELTDYDITKFSYENIQRLLVLIPMSDAEEKKISRKFRENVKKAKASEHYALDTELRFFFKDIQHKIVTYLHDFEEIDREQDKNQKAMIEEYTKYIQLLKKESFQLFFEDFKNLEKLMGKISIPMHDRALILKYLALQNIKVVNPDLSEMTEEYLNLSCQTSKFLAKCQGNYEKAEERKVLEMVNDQGIQIDVDLIPMISLNIAERMSMSVEAVKNVLLANVLMNLFEGYQQATIKKDEDLQLYYKEQLNALLKFEKKVKCRAIVDAEELLRNNQEMCELIEGFGPFVDEYENRLVSEIEQDFSIDHALAVRFKSMPIVREIKTTLAHLKLLDPRDEHYGEGIKVLKELMKEYSELNKNEKKRKK